MTQPGFARLREWFSPRRLCLDPFLSLPGFGSLSLVPWGVSGAISSGRLFKKYAGTVGAVWQLLKKKLNIDLPYDAATPLPGMDPKEMKLGLEY